MCVFEETMKNAVVKVPYDVTILVKKNEALINSLKEQEIQMGFIKSHLGL